MKVTRSGRVYGGSVKVKATQSTQSTSAEQRLLSQVLHACDEDGNNVGLHALSNVFLTSAQTGNTHMMLHIVNSVPHIRISELYQFHNSVRVLNVGDATTPDILLLLFKRVALVEADKIAAQTCVSKMAQCGSSLLCTCIDVLHQHWASTLSPILHDVLYSAFLCAAKYGHLRAVDTILTLWPDFDPSQENETPLGIACDCGHAPIVARLLRDTRVNPASDHSYALWSACECNHTEIVAMLMHDGRADPNELNQCAITAAGMIGNPQVLRLFVDDARVNNVDVFVACLLHPDNAQLAHTLLTQDPRVQTHVLSRPACNFSQIIECVICTNSYARYSFFMTDCCMNFLCPLCKAQVSSCPFCRKHWG